MTNYLVTMRLAEMRRIHPSQDNTRLCALCRSRVGVYPTGQRALLRDPELRIMCHRCYTPSDAAVENVPAGSLDEIMQEARDSTDVGEA